MDADIFDARPCRLGEGPLWHPEREELFWVDIPDQKVLSRGPAGARERRFDEMVSALALIDRDTLLLATESGLQRLAIGDWSTRPLCAIEADDPSTRSNDGRADPWGGFWIGTMAKDARAGAGSIYRWHRGVLRRVVPAITVPNGLCFDHGRRLAYYTDSAARRTWRIVLDGEGWPAGAPELFLDFAARGITIDGAVIDAEGYLWCAIYDGGKVLRIAPSGEVAGAIEIGTPRVTCPAFGGPGQRDLFVTSAAIGVDAPAAGVPHGATLRFAGVAAGVAEPRVILPDSIERTA